MSSIKNEYQKRTMKITAKLTDAKELNLGAEEWGKKYSVSTLDRMFFSKIQNYKTWMPKSWFMQFEDFPGMFPVFWPSNSST